LACHAAMVVAAASTVVIAACQQACGGQKVGRAVLKQPRNAVLRAVT
jgi:hypothetical protein